MAKIIGQIESLKSLKAELNKRNINRFNSVGDINRFCDEFALEKKKVIEFHENSLNKEIKQKIKQKNYHSRQWYQYTILYLLLDYCDTSWLHKTDQKGNYNLKFDQNTW